MNNDIMRESNTNSVKSDIRMYKEFSLLIYNLSEMYSKEYGKLSKTLNNYNIKSRKNNLYVKAKVIFARKIFLVFKKIVDFLGLKESLKKTNLYRKLYLNGIIGKLQGKD
jgi:hypothetical protein